MESGRKKVKEESGRHAYEQQFLSNIHNKVSCYDEHLLSVLGELGLLRCVVPKSMATPGVTLVRKK